MSDLLLRAFENLKSAAMEYEKAREAEGWESDATIGALRRYLAREKDFNLVLGFTIRQAGEIPQLAHDALHFQRFHGFHGRGTAKIISVHSQR